MTAAAAAAAPLIDWATLGRVFLISLVVGVGVVIVFTAGVFSLSTIRRPGVTAMARAVGSTVTTIAGAALVATVGWGLYFIVHK